MKEAPITHSLLYMKQRAKEEDISPATLNQAKKLCGIVSKRLSKERAVWNWSTV